MIKTTGDYMELTYEQANKAQKKLIEYIEDLPYYSERYQILISNRHFYDFIAENISCTDRYTTNYSTHDVSLDTAVMSAYSVDYFDQDTYLTYILTDYLNDGSVEYPFEDFKETLSAAIKNSEWSETIDKISFIIGQDNAFNYLCHIQRNDNMENDFRHYILSDIIGEVLVSFDSIDLLSIVSIKEDGINYKSIDCEERYEQILPFTDESICLYNEKDQTITLITEEENSIQLNGFRVDEDGDLNYLKLEIDYGDTLCVMGQCFSAEKGISEVIEMYADGSDTKIYKKPETNQDAELKPEEPKRRNKNKP